MTSILIFDRRIQAELSERNAKKTPDRNRTAAATGAKTFDMTISIGKAAMKLSVAGERQTKPVKS